MFITSSSTRLNLQLVLKPYGNQILQAFSWIVGDSITWPLLEEIEQIVTLFYAVAAHTPGRTLKPHPTVEKILRAFNVNGLKLLQQLNYAITHPNHLTSLLEPVMPEERSALEKEQNGAQAGFKPVELTARSSVHASLLVTFVKRFLRSATPIVCCFCLKTTGHCKLSYVLSYM